jgi:hypothetical protein
MPAMPHDPLPALRRRRPLVALGLAALVLWLHSLLIAALAPAPPLRPGERGAARPALQVRALSPPQPPAAPPPLRAEAAAMLPPAPALGARPAPPTPTTPPAPAIASVGGGVAPAAAAAMPAVDAVDAAADRGAALPAEPGDAGAPPVYATRLPAPVLLRYALRYNGQAGEATLAWRHDGQAYTLALEGRAATQPLLAQASQGGFDGAGLAPEHFLDRRRGTRQQAAHFRRDIGRIAFSGPATEYPAWPGAQDRLSWLPQLAAILAAAAAPPAAVSLFVVDARGAGGLWHFAPQGEVTLATALGERPAALWRREPPRPEGLRVEAWLDAGFGHWPLQLRFTALRSGDVFELALIAEPALPP